MLSLRAPGPSPLRQLESRLEKELMGLPEDFRGNGGERFTIELVDARHPLTWPKDTDRQRRVYAEESAVEGPVMEAAEGQPVSYVVRPLLLNGVDVSGLNLGSLASVLATLAADRASSESPVARPETADSRASRNLSKGPRSYRAFRGAVLGGPAHTRTTKRIDEACPRQGHAAGARAQTIPSAPGRPLPELPAGRRRDGRRRPSRPPYGGARARVLLARVPASLQASEVARPLLDRQDEGKSCSGSAAGCRHPFRGLDSPGGVGPRPPARSRARDSAPVGARQPGSRCCNSSRLSRGRP